MFIVTSFFFVSNELFIFYLIFWTLYILLIFHLQWIFPDTFAIFHICLETLIINIATYDSHFIADHRGIHHHRKRKEGSATIILSKVIIGVRVSLSNHIFPSSNVRRISAPNPDEGLWMWWRSWEGGCDLGDVASRHGWETVKQPPQTLTLLQSERPLVMSLDEWRRMSLTKPDILIVEIRTSQSSCSRLSWITPSSNIRKRNTGSLNCPPWDDPQRAL